MRFGGRRFYNVLNPVDDQCYLTIEFSLQWFWALMGCRPQNTFDSYCHALTEALAEIPQMSSITWADYRH